MQVRGPDPWVRVCVLCVHRRRGRTDLPLIITISLFTWCVCEKHMFCVAGDMETPAMLYFSGPHNDKLLRRNMTIMKSSDNGKSWRVHVVVDTGEVSYSAMQIVPQLPHRLSPTPSSENVNEIGILYERSETYSVVFEPDEIVFVRYPLATV